MLLSMHRKSKLISNVNTIRRLQQWTFRDKLMQKNGTTEDSEGLGLARLPFYSNKACYIGSISFIG
jgi:hypothetical protein